MARTQGIQSALAKAREENGVLVEVNSERREVAPGLITHKRGCELKGSDMLCPQCSSLALWSWQWS